MLDETDDSEEEFRCSEMEPPQPSAPSETDLWRRPMDPTEGESFEAPCTGEESLQSFLNLPVAHLESISHSDERVVYNYQNDHTRYDTPSLPRDLTPRELERRFQYIEAIANEEDFPVREIIPIPATTYQERLPTRNERQVMAIPVTEPYTLTDDDTFVAQDEDHHETPATNSTALASGVAGAVVGTLVLGTIPGVIAGFYAVYVHNDRGAAGDISRALGEVALVTREKALSINARHHVVEKVKVALRQTFHLALELNRQHQISQRVKRFSRFAWTLTFDYICRQAHELQSHGDQRPARGRRSHQRERVMIADRPSNSRNRSCRQGRGGDGSIEERAIAPNRGGCYGQGGAAPLPPRSYPARSY